MKKIWFLLLVLTLLSTLAIGCGPSEPVEAEDPQEKEEEQVDENAEFIPLVVDSLKLTIDVPQKGWENTRSRATLEEFEDDNGHFEIWFSTTHPNVRRLTDASEDAIVDLQDVEVTGLDEKAAHVKITATEEGTDVYKEQLYYEYVNPDNDRHYYVLITMTYPQDGDTEYYSDKFSHIISSATIGK
ncbi:hypothetical protein PRVXH_001208 [Proteinivorax hydrogeniformans]|uniref:Lipoprotein n=1 Tax=Proteinivorax hydrogeniformans TaxID=1826727 RepID=A0AAU8HWS1_9FIRM